jgi:alpha-beta hydrolase superfamily lysophospholipase
MSQYERPMSLDAPDKRQTPFRTVAAWSLTLILIPVHLTGCNVYQHAERPRQPASMLAVAPNDWPPRSTDTLLAKAGPSPADITEFVLDGTRPANEVPPDYRDRLTKPIGRVSYAGIHGMGILRVVEGRRDISSGGAASSEPNRPSGSFRFVSYSPVQDRPRDTRFDGWLKRLSTATNNVLASRKLGIKANDPDVVSMLYEGTSIRLRPPTEGAAPRGLIIHMAGLGSTEYEQPLIDEFARRGWYVLRVATPRVWWFEEKKYDIPTRADVPVVARKLATHLDDLVAESAYAAEAAVDYLRTHRPDVPLHPMVMIGCSAGSLAAPAVVARMQSAFDGAVLVGAGANLLEISQKSDLTNSGIRLQWPDNLAKPAWRQQLFDEYLKQSKLDPYHTALALRDKPVLMVHANLDATVPADNGRLLWERLDRPDRYTHIFGHRLLFFTLPSQVDRIADWIDRSIAPELRHARAEQLPLHNGSVAASQ